MRLRPHAKPVVRETCKVCWNRGYDLWVGSCLCSGHVKLPFQIPGKLAFNPSYPPSLYRPKSADKKK